MYRFSDWAFTHVDRPDHCYPWWMDARHTFLLYRVACLGIFRNVLEVGCHHGSSTSAFLQALKEGAHFELTLCEPNVNPVLLEAVTSCQQPVTLLASDSLKAIKPAYDLIVLDGDHTIGQVSRELGLVLLHQTKTIIAHDTNAVNIPGCEGTVFLGKVLQAHPEYDTLADNLSRDGEYTERGLTLATRNKAILELIRPIWDEIMGRDRESFL